MYLVRRKSDGKWWTNPSNTSKYCGRKFWVDTPENILPFRTISGAKTALYHLGWIRDHEKGIYKKIENYFNDNFELISCRIHLEN